MPPKLKTEPGPSKSRRTQAMPHRNRNDAVAHFQQLLRPPRQLTTQSTHLDPQMQQSFAQVLLGNAQQQLIPRPLTIHPMQMHLDPTRELLSSAQASPEFSLQQPEPIQTPVFPTPFNPPHFSPIFPLPSEIPGCPSMKAPNGPQLFYEPLPYDMSDLQNLGEVIAAIDNVMIRQNALLMRPSDKANPAPNHWSDDVYLHNEKRRLKEELLGPKFFFTGPWFVTDWVVEHEKFQETFSIDPTAPGFRWVPHRGSYIYVLNEEQRQKAMEWISMRMQVIDAGAKQTVERHQYYLGVKKLKLLRDSHEHAARELALLQKEEEDKKFLRDNIRELLTKKTALARHRAITEFRLHPKANMHFFDSVLKECVEARDETLMLGNPKLREAHKALGYIPDEEDAEDRTDAVDEYDDKKYADKSLEVDRFDSQAHFKAALWIDGVEEQDGFDSQEHFNAAFFGDDVVEEQDELIEGDGDGDDGI